VIEIYTHRAICIGGNPRERFSGLIWNVKRLDLGKMGE
jgi:hypothetical protein